MIRKKAVTIVEQELWVKEVENPVLRPINQWRDELYGYWMVFSDTIRINDEKMVIARYYGTDRVKLYELYNKLHNTTNEPTVGIIHNNRSNWLGGVFLAKTEG